MNILTRLWKEEEGQGITEYGLIVGLVVIMGIAIAALFEEQLNALFDRIGERLEEAVPGS